MATTTTTEQALPGAGRPPRFARVAVLRRNPYSWLAIGSLLQLFAVGGRWDLPLAAWFFQIFLIRFLRAGRAVPGLVLVWLVGVGGALFWVWQLAVPMTVLTFAGALLLGSAGLVPFAVDRLVCRRIGWVGRLLAFPASLTAVAFLLGTLNPFGTAYGLLAFTQHENLALLQVLSVAGPYSIAFLIGVVATAANHLWEHGVSWRGIRPAVAVVTGLTVVIVGGQARLAFAPAPGLSTVRIAGINPSKASLTEARRLLGTDPTDLESVHRVDVATVRAASDVLTRQLFADTRQAARAGAKIVFWSENAARIRSEDERRFLADAAALAREEGVYLDIGANILLPDAPYGRDQTVLIGPDGTVLWTYQKSHPIPGLERYKPGEQPAPVVDTPYGRLSNVICYDADFPAMMRVDADIMLVPGGDWPEMGRVHTRMAGLRAIENGYSLVRQDFNGSSQAFDNRGRVLSIQDTTSGDGPPWIVDVPTGGVTTPYRVLGDVFAWLCTGLTLAVIGLAVRRSRRTGWHESRE
ncbi:nitrilase-related carbon-nitrogen hydrolase [Actinophytocola sp.]|uniref:nitrilase-related carbon-nitrogen hydrolase n=1 Tax=Actinophytocola sp. TaxID=1872138 RepID=UPI002D665750|nr:nitrilase-related carbon-nitrogen hydrolase [Actinophytocola sp.]HYQ69884.1 nitrilase-related carbon-nitrogen hydrolase [Actinophytocola sp.]